MSVFDAFFPAAFASHPLDRAAERPSPPSSDGRESSPCGCGSDSAPAVGAHRDGSEDPGLGRTLNAWVRERPESLELFHELGLDACCGGERTLEEACRRHGLDARAVLARLG